MAFAFNPDLSEAQTQAVLQKLKTEWQQKFSGDKILSALWKQIEKDQKEHYPDPGSVIALQNSIIILLNHQFRMLPSEAIDQKAAVLDHIFKKGTAFFDFCKDVDPTINGDYDYLKKEWESTSKAEAKNPDAAANKILAGESAKKGVAGKAPAKAAVVPSSTPAPAKRTTLIIN